MGPTTGLDILEKAKICPCRDIRGSPACNLVIILPIPAVNERKKQMQQSSGQCATRQGGAVYESACCKLTS